jgi:heme/copper-type cytochrome/quinol oxidase subunit 4
MTGVLLALLLLTVAGQLFAMGGMMEPTVTRWTFYLLGLATVAMALGAFQHLSDYRWRWHVRRDLEQVAT